VSTECASIGQQTAKIRNGQHTRCISTK